MDPSETPGGGPPGGPSAPRGIVVASSDDWMLSDTAFDALPADTSRFAVNLSRLLTDGSPGRIHAYSDFFAYTGAQLRQTFEGEGHTFTVGTGVTFELQTLTRYDALLLGLPLLTSTQLDVLSQYLEGGGRVYIHAGNGIGQPTLVPDAWNPLLARYNVQLQPGFNSLRGAVSIASTHPLLERVSRLYMDAGHPIAGCCVAATAGGAAVIVVVAQ